MGSEWRTFSSDNGANGDPSRVGAAENGLLSSGGSISTVIGTVTNGAASSAGDPLKYTGKRQVCEVKVFFFLILTDLNCQAII